MPCCFFCQDLPLFTGHYCHFFTLLLSCKKLSEKSYKHKTSTGTRKMNKNRQVVASLKGSLENGEVFEQTPEDLPIVIELGQNNIFPLLEKALENMQPGETRTIPLAPEDAYGPHHKDLVQIISMSSFSGSIQPKPGMILSLNIEKDGRQEKVPASVVDIENEKVTIDFNHPLAGKSVIYTLTVHNFRN